METLENKTQGWSWIRTSLSKVEINIITINGQYWGKLCVCIKAAFVSATPTFHLHFIRIQFLKFLGIFISTMDQNTDRGSFTLTIQQVKLQPKFNPSSVCMVYIEGLMQERRNPIANALELRLSCTNPST